MLSSAPRISSSHGECTEAQQSSGLGTTEAGFDVDPELINARIAPAYQAEILRSIDRYCNRRRSQIPFGVLQFRFKFLSRLIHASLSRAPGKATPMRTQVLENGTTYMESHCALGSSADWVPNLYPYP